MELGLDTFLFYVIDLKKKSIMTAQFGEVSDSTVQEEGKQLEKEFLESGIQGFDDAIGNGLPIGNIYLLCGHFANGSDIFVQQVLNKRISSNDKVAYYTVEQSSNDTINAMKLYGMNIQEYVNNNSWMFFRMLHTSLKNVSSVIPKVSTEQQISFDNISILMKHFQEKAEEGFNTCINFSSLMRNFSLKEMSDFLFFMQNVVRVTGGIHFVLINEDEHKPSDISTLKNMADTVFNFSSEIREQNIDVTLTIQKIKDLVPKTRVLRFTIKEKGLDAETIRRIK